MSPQAFLLKAQQVKVLPLKAPPIPVRAIKSLKLSALSFKDMTLKTVSLDPAPQPAAARSGAAKSSVAKTPAPQLSAWQAGARSERMVDRLQHIEPATASPRTRATVLTASLAAMALLATGGMVMGPPFEPVRLSGMNAEKTVGYPVFDRYGDSVGHVASVENVDGHTMWVNVALPDGAIAKVASFRGFVDARNKEVGLILTKDAMDQRAVDQANDAADEAAFKAVMGDDDVSAPAEPADPKKT